MGRVAAGRPVVVRAGDLVLREWTLEDVPVMVSLFDTHEVDRWTPLAHPFDEEVAAAYVERAHRSRAEGTLQLAITEGWGEPLGEVLLFRHDHPRTCELGYAVGERHHGRRLAARAVRALLPFAYDEGYRQARLTIAVDNVPSQRVAVATGFSLSDEPVVRRERKGYVLDLATWTRALLPSPA